MTSIDGVEPGENRTPRMKALQLRAENGPCRGSVCHLGSVTGVGCSSRIPCPLESYRLHADFTGADQRFRPHDGPDSGPILETVVFRDAEKAIDQFFGEGTTQKLLNAQGHERPAEDAEIKWDVCENVNPVFGVVYGEGFEPYTVIFDKELTEMSGEGSTLANNGYPDGNPKTAMGMKKPDISVVPPAGILQLSLAMMNGANKYGPFNWREKSISTRPYIAAAMRHLLAYLDGEEYSQDTVEAGKPVHHLGHVMACCAILLDAREIEGGLNDNRPSVPGPAGRMIEQYNASGSFDSDHD